MQVKTEMVQAQDFIYLVVQLCDMLRANLVPSICRKDYDYCKIIYYKGGFPTHLVTKNEIIYRFQFESKVVGRITHRT